MLQLEDSTDLTISVEQRHIDEGKRLDCECCPIALALREVLAERFDYAPEDYMRVGHSQVFVWDVDYRGYLDGVTPVGRITLPAPAQRFISTFDLAATCPPPPPPPPQPFTFEARLHKWSSHS